MRTFFLAFNSSSKQERRVRVSGTTRSGWKQAHEDSARGAGRGYSKEGGGGMARSQPKGMGRGYGKQGETGEESDQVEGWVMRRILVRCPPGGRGAGGGAVKSWLVRSQPWRGIWKG